MDITLANFQIKAISDLMGAMLKPNKEIVLKSCTGSGKTIIMTHFMDEYKDSLTFLKTKKKKTYLMTIGLIMFHQHLLKLSNGG